MSKVCQILGITYTIASKCQKCQKCSDGELDEMAESRLLGGGGQKCQKCHKNREIPVL